MTADMGALWPEEIRLSKSKDNLFVKFDNGSGFKGHSKN